MADDVRLYHINTSTLNNLNNRQFAFESSNDVDLGWKMAGGKNNSGEVTKFLGKDKAAKVSTFEATGAVTISSGSITIDSLSLSTANSYQLLFGDFQQASTLKFEDGKLRVGSTSTPEYAVDIESTSQDHIRLQHTGPDANGPLVVLEKTSASPANDDSCGKIVFRGTNDDPSVPEVDFASIEGFSDDVSSDSTDGSLVFKTKVGGVDTTTISLKTGRVGINIGNPQSQLHVNHTGSTTTAITLGDQSTIGNNTGLYIRTSGVGYIGTGSASGKLRVVCDGFGTNSNGITVLNGGNVGVNNESPSLPLDVNGNVLFNGYMNIGHSTGATPAASHTCVYAKSDDTLHMIADDASTKEIITLSSTRNIQWTTFTPTVTLVGGTGNTVPVYTTNTGRYRRYDDIVYVEVTLSGDGGDEGSGTGVINIALPVTAGANIAGFTNIPIGTIYNYESYYLLNGTISTSANTVLLTYRTDASTIVNATGSLQNNANRSIIFNFWYEVD